MAFAIATNRAREGSARARSPLSRQYPATAREPSASPNKYAPSRTPNVAAVPPVMIDSTRYQTISYESAMNPDSEATPIATLSTRGASVSAWIGSSLDAPVALQTAGDSPKTRDNVTST